MSLARNISLLFLLLAGSLLCPVSLRAQSSNAGQTFELSSANESGPGAPEANTPSQEIPSRERDWVFGFGAIGALYHSSATIGTSGQVIPGATANVSNNLTVMFDVRRYIMKNLSLSVMGGVPPMPTIKGKGSVHYWVNLEKFDMVPRFSRLTITFQGYVTFDPI